MLTEKIKEVVLLILLLLAIATVQGQQANMTEDDVIAKAKVLFEQEKWVEALPLYAQLVSVHPEIPEYNYKFGVCTLLGNRTDRRRPVRYLNKAYRTMADKAELLYYLGLAYYQNQEFANAMKFLNLYLAKLDANSTQRPRILEQINACLNGMNLEHKNLIEEIVSKTEFQADNFHRAYRADDLDGSLILKPENFISSKEKSSGEKSFVFVSEPREELYYSGYMDNGGSHRDIFKVELKKNGEWGDPARITDAVNTNFDENYPVVTNNGQTLYFSSKGHNSLGGYDIYKSTLDPQTEEFGPPENMGMGINSPFDDILFIPDNTGSGAFFASNRDNLADGINVFRIRLNNMGFEDQHILAQQSIQTKIEGAVENNSNNIGNEAKKEVIAQNTEPVNPQKKAANLVQQTAYVNKLVDSAYLLVSNMKSQIRDLTNKRDRANMISSGKSDKAKNLEIEFENIINNLPTATSKEEFEKELAKAVKYKEDIYQYRQRSDQANLIAWNLGKQVKIKNAELKQLKLDAGEVQTLSLSGDFEHTKSVYSTVMISYAAADTLADYSQNIKWVNLDKITFDVPKTEVAFAEQMRDGYENQTLLAMTQAKTQENKKFDESIPINVIDNRVSAETPSKPAIIVLKQVEQVGMNLFANVEEPAIEDDLEIMFGIDAIKPYDLVEQIQFREIAFAELEEQDLEMNFAIDQIEAEPLVIPVSFDETAYALNMDDEELILNEKIDWITPANVVQTIQFDETAYALSIEDEELFINEKIDWITPANVVESVQFDETAYALNIEDEELFINEKIDWIAPANVVETIQFDETAYALNIEDEELFINEKIDWITPSNVVESVQFDETAYALNIEDEELFINEKIDWIAPANVVESVQFDETAYALNIDEPGLELGKTIDQIAAEPLIHTIAFNDGNDVSPEADELLEINIEADAIKAFDLVETVAFTELAMETGNEELELQHDVDAARLVHQVEQVTFTEIADVNIEDQDLEISNIKTLDPYKVVEEVKASEYVSNSMPADEMLEISNFNDQVVAADQIQAIAYNKDAGIDFEDESLEISHDAQPEPIVLAQVSPVQFTGYSSGVNYEDEALEVRLEKEKIKAANLIIPIEYSENAFAFDSKDEAIEINIESDPIEVVVLRKQVQSVQMAYSNSDIPDEDLELNFTLDVIPALDIVEPVYTNTYAFSGMEINETLEILFEIDAPQPIEPYDLIEVVSYTEYASSFVMDEENLELSYGVDEMKNEGLMADNAGISSRDVSSVSEMPTTDAELYYLRESVSMAANIETSRTDFELLAVAIESPDDLSYEELLFAASLAPIPEDKLKIYNYAFIHIDRDWRAFNNAAVTSMNMKDLDQAEVYLYQASLISDENGKVENNKGILACYKNDFNSAETHFLAASQMGVNADYNLQLIQSLVSGPHKKTNSLKREVGNVKMKRK